MKERKKERKKKSNLKEKTLRTQVPVCI
jgi:hypothetical protein